MSLRWHFALLWAHLTYQIGEKTQLKTDVAYQDRLKMDCKLIFSQFLTKLRLQCLLLFRNGSQY